MLDIEILIYLSKLRQKISVCYAFHAKIHYGLLVDERQFYLKKKCGVFCKVLASQSPVPVKHVWILRRV